MDEFIYHEALVHPAMVTHPSPEEIFVAGGAEGCVLREILRHNTVRTITMIDIDEDLVELCKRELFKWHGNSFYDSRVNVKYQDARRHLESTDQKYDCIFVDVTDAGQEKALSKFLFTLEFYRTVSRCIKDDGIFVTRSQSASINNLEPLLSIIKTLKQVFPIVRPFIFYEPFCSDLYSTVLASGRYDSQNHTPEQIDQILESRGAKDLRFYSGATHIAIQSLPKYIEDIKEKKGRILTDAEPFLWKVGGGVYYPTN